MRIAPLNEWRTGSKVGRTIYLGDDLIGVMDTRELARQVVDAVNSSAARDRVLEAALVLEEIFNREELEGWEQAVIDQAKVVSALVNKLNTLTAKAKEGSDGG